MGNIQTLAAFLPLQKKSLWPPSCIEIIECDIAKRLEEVDFYDKLLSWLLLSCSDEKRPRVQAFRDELSALLRNKFAVLLDSLGVFKDEALKPSGLPELHPDFNDCRQRFDQLDNDFQVFKSRIHRSFSDFMHVQIW